MLWNVVVFDMLSMEGAENSKDDSIMISDSKVQALKMERSNANGAQEIQCDLFGKWDLEHAPFML